MREKPSKDHPWRKQVIGWRKTEEDQAVEDRQDLEDRLEMMADKELDRVADNYGADSTW